MDFERRNDTEWPNPTLLAYTLPADGQGEGERERWQQGRNEQNMNALNYVFGSLFVFASWANETRLFGKGGDDLFSLLFAIVGLVLLAAGVTNSCRAKKTDGTTERPQTR